MTDKKIINNDGDEFLLIDDDAPQPVDDALLGLLTDLGGEDDVEVRVYRAGANRQMDFLFVTTPNDFSLETIRNEWGGGDFRIHVKKNSKLVANRKISIAVKPVPDVAVIPPNQDGEAMLEMFKESMNRQVEQSKSMTELLLTLLVKQQNPPPPAIQPQAEQFSPIEMQKSMMEMMVAMKALTETEKPSNDLTQIDTLMKGIELAKDMQVGEKDASSTDVLLQAIKSFGGPLTQMAQVQGAAVPDTTNNAQDTGESGEVMWWKMQLKMLLGQAKKNKDPYLYANLIVDQVPPEKVTEFLSSETAIESLILIVPEIATVRPWFEQLLLDVKELSADEETPEKNEHLTDSKDDAHISDEETQEKNEHLTDSQDDVHTSGDAITGEVVIPSG